MFTKQERLKTKQPTRPLAFLCNHPDYHFIESCMDVFRDSQKETQKATHQEISGEVCIWNEIVSKHLFNLFLSLSLSLSLSLLSLFCSLSLLLFLSLSHTHTLSLSHPPSLTLSHSLSLTLSIYLLFVNFFLFLLVFFSSFIKFLVRKFLNLACTSKFLCIVVTVTNEG